MTRANAADAAGKMMNLRFSVASDGSVGAHSLRQLGSGHLTGNSEITIE